MLERFNIIDIKMGSVPLPPHGKLSKEGRPKDDAAANSVKAVSYTSACVSLMYAMIATN